MEIHGLNVEASTLNWNHQGMPPCVLLTWLKSDRLLISKSPHPSKLKHKKLVPSPILSRFIKCRRKNLEVIF